MGILNVKSFVPVTLDLIFSHYNRWCGLFLNTLERYALADHVLNDEDFFYDIVWKCMDCTMPSWLYGNITSELHKVVTNRVDGPPTCLDRIGETVHWQS